MRRWLPPSLIALAAALLAWLLLRDPQSTTPIGDTTGGASAAERASAEEVQRRGDDAPREEVALAPSFDRTAMSKGLRWRVRLRGVSREVPWTAHAALRLAAFDRREGTLFDFEAVSPPDDEARFAFAVPDWCGAGREDAELVVAWLSSQDPNYEPLSWRTEVVDLERELVLDVELCGVLTGCVRDSAGAPVEYARVVAFPLRDGRPLPGIIATAPTGADGSYRMLVTPGSSLWLVALPCRRTEIVGRRYHHTSWQMAKDLLPATRVATALVAAPTSVPDFVLERTAHVMGTVKWDDGTPVAYATVEAQPRGGDAIALTDHEFVHRRADGRLAPRMRTRTDENGEFALPAVPDTTIDVQLVQLLARDNLPRLLGSGPRKSGSSASPIAFTLPRRIVLCARADGQPVENPAFEFEDECVRGGDKDGVVTVVLTATQRVRASERDRRSAWYEIGPADSGRTVDLALEPITLTAVTVELADETRRYLTIRVRRDGGPVTQVFGREALLDPGSYTFDATSTVGDGDRFFQLIDDEVHVVLSAPMTVRLDGSSGGTFEVKATDARGAWVAGTCTVRDAAGREWRGAFRDRDANTGRSGELLANGANTFLRRLPSGDYELRCDFGAHGTHRETVSVRTNEVTSVRIRLP